MLAEDLVRVRRPDDRERYAASQRQARIDPNPHQIDAVIFALRRLREGGCILADEVGLGKMRSSSASTSSRLICVPADATSGDLHTMLLSSFAKKSTERGPKPLHNSLLPLLVCGEPLRPPWRRLERERLE
jgi:hypothetical protein